MRTARSPAFRALPIATVATGIPAGIWTIDRSESSPSSWLSGTGTPITGSGVIDAVMPGRCAAPPAPAITTLSPRPAAPRAYSIITSGVRCADTIRTSCATPNSTSTSIAPCIVGRSESLPMITPTRGLPTSATLMDTCRMRTRLTRMLGVEHPVMLAGMGGVSYPRVVAAVSDAGGFGTLGAATMSSQQLDDEMSGVRKLTTKPFGVDLLAALPERMVDDAHKVVEGGASLFVAGLGVPRDVIKVLHDGNVLVASMCGKVRHAIAAVEAGCDFVIAQGTEAGGHTGTVATMPLVPQIVDAVAARVPVVAAGGIFDGRGLAAAIALGADGVWLGTRFIATPEARAVTGYKDALLRAHEDDTVISRGFTGKTLRAIRNQWTDYIEQHPEELSRFPEQMGKAVAANALHLGGDENTPVDRDKECYPSGQGVGAIDELVPAGEIVRRIVDEAEHALARAAGTVVR